MARCWSKIADFSQPHLYLAPQLGANLVPYPLEFIRDLWHQKLRLPGLSYGVRCVTLFSRFGRTPTCDSRTDRRKDRRRQHIPHQHDVAR